MKTKHYSSYAEIDRALEILKLERQLHLEKVKLGIEHTKDTMKLGNLVEGYVGFSSTSNSGSMISKIIHLALPFVVKYIKRKWS